MKTKTDEELRDIYELEMTKFNNNGGRNTVLSVVIDHDINQECFYAGYRSAEQSLQSEIEKWETEYTRLVGMVERLDKSNMEKEGRIVKLEDEIESCKSALKSFRDDLNNNPPEKREYCKGCQILSIKDEYDVDNMINTQKSEIQRLTTLSEQQTLKIVQLERELSVRVDYASECRDLGYKLQTVEQNNKNLWIDNKRLESEAKKYDDLVKGLENIKTFNHGETVYTAPFRVVYYQDIQNLINGEK